MVVTFLCCPFTQQLDPLCSLAVFVASHMYSLEFYLESRAQFTDWIPTQPQFKFILIYQSVISIINQIVHTSNIPQIFCRSVRWTVVFFMTHLCIVDPLYMLWVIPCTISHLLHPFFKAYTNKYYVNFLYGIYNGFFIYFPSFIEIPKHRFRLPH